MEKRKTVGFLGGKFLPFHQGHVYLILEASNMVDELYIVTSSSENRDKEICERDGIKYMPADLRLTWVGNAISNLENVKILHIKDDQWDKDYDWEAGANAIKKAIGKHIDYVFSSEEEYSERFKKFYPDTEHIVVDDKRKTVNISATQLRKNLYDNWDKLPSAVRKHFTKKIAVVGTESTGKSTLVKKLAKFYNTNFVHEVGRDYCEKYSDKLTVPMFDSIAMEHCLLQEKKSEDSNKLLLVDSDAVITQFYLDMYFNGAKSSLIEEIIKKQQYDLVLYLEPDVPWVSDGLRAQGKDDERRKNNETLKKMYADRGIDFVVINGNYDERFKKARKCIDDLFVKKN